MTSQSDAELRSLRDQPFDLLRELERRSKAALAGALGNDVDVECRVRTVFDYSHALISGNRHYSGSADFVRLCA